MNLITSSTIASSSSSQACHAAISLFTNLDIRIQKIRQKCDELRKQSPKYLSLYKFGFAISVIGATVALCLRNPFFWIGFTIAKVFWNTISRNNNRMKSIDNLEETEIAQQRVLDYIHAFQLKILDFDMSSQLYLLKLSSNCANSKEEIQQFLQEIHIEIQKNEQIDAEIQKDKQFVLPDYRTDIFRLELKAQAKNIQDMKKDFSDPIQECSADCLSKLNPCLELLKKSCNSIFAIFEKSVKDAWKDVEIQTALTLHC